ncbi:hypothetical protein [Amphibacillus cookii]|uniref:hypothetical protein n=1 Tax=Amphibacillus cookii TaxID=767787 RepID=UPI001959709D|nr:hypothetical protein [Amphibacillus cookii]MBM7541783.1 hypothetical protein [Amphibacillus cookii]
MTSNPFKQIVVMHERIKAKKYIKHCYKLFYQDALWLQVLNERVQDIDKPSDLNQNIDHLKQLFLREANFVSLNKQKRDMVKEAVIYLIEQLFITSRLSSNPFTQLRRDWINVSWVIIFKPKLNRLETYAENIKYLIDDIRFRQVMTRVLYQLKVEEFDRYLHLLQAIYLSNYILPKLKASSFIESFSLCIDQFTYLGLITTKVKVINLYQYLRNITGYHMNAIDFQHFSVPIQLHGLEVKRDQKNNKICIEIPQHLLIKLTQMFQYGHFHQGKARARGYLIHRSISEIINVYQRELLVTVPLYDLVDNCKPLNRFLHFAYQSLLRTIAVKKNCSIKKAASILEEKNVTMKQMTHVYKSAGEPYTSKGVRTVLREVSRYHRNDVDPTILHHLKKISMLQKG